MMKKFMAVSVLSVVLIVATACSSRDPSTPTEVVTQAVSGSTSRETPAGTPAAPVETSEPGTGRVIGVLIRRGLDGEEDRPYQSLRVYLGTVLLDDQGNLTVGRVNQLDAPSAQTDDSGRFVFANVDPGTYILAIQLPPNNIIMLRDPDSGNDLVIDVEADQVLDLGEMRYDFVFGNP